MPATTVETGGHAGCSLRGVAANDNGWSLHVQGHRTQLMVGTPCLPTCLPCRQWVVWTIPRASGFAPGEALPPGYVITTHPEGHSAPQEGHAMSEMASASFVIPASSAAAAVKTGSAVKSKKSKKKKSSGCC